MAAAAAPLFEENQCIKGMEDVLRRTRKSRPGRGLQAQPPLLGHSTSPSSSSPSSSSSSTLVLSGAFCFHLLLHTHTPASWPASRPAYPHCSLFAFPFTPGPSFARFAAAPLFELAIAHRRSVVRPRTPPALAFPLRYVRAPSWGRPRFDRRLGCRGSWPRPMNHFMITNKVEGVGCGPERRGRAGG